MRLISRIMLELWPFALVIALWQFWIVVDAVQPIVAPAPLAVFVKLAQTPLDYAADALLTLRVAGAGLALGMGLGVGAAALAWISPLFSGLVGPTALIVQTVPVIAMIPVIARLVGFNDYAIVIVAALIAFFPAFVLVRAGLTATPPGSEDLFRVLGASRRMVFLRLAVPAAVPNFLTALRISAVLSVVGALTGEWLLGTAGIGYRLALSQINLQARDAWAASLVAVAVSLAIYGLATYVKRRSDDRFTA